MSAKYALAIAIVLLRVADVAAGQDEPQWIVFDHDSVPDLAVAVADSATLTRSQIRALRVLSPVDHRAIAGYFPELEEPLHRAFHDKDAGAAAIRCIGRLPPRCSRPAIPSIRTRT